ncbi:MAG: hypothetical protein RR086_03895 [Clostridia bacterium]
MNKTLDCKINSAKVGKPNKLIFHTLAQFLKASKQHNCSTIINFDLNSYKGTPVVFLSAHAQRTDFSYLCETILPFYPCAVVGYLNIMSKSRYFLMGKLNVISKKLYEPDYLAVAKIMRAIKDGRSILLFPEGIQSTSGSNQPINPTTIKLLKKLGVPVISIHSCGAYLTLPRFATAPRIGKITYTYDLLFSAQQVKDYSAEKMYEMVKEKLKFNDFEYNKTARIKYIGKEPNAKGVTKILYKCPCCGEEFTLSEYGENVKCSNCGYGVNINEYYDLTPLKPNDFVFNDIDKWYKWQRKEVRKEVLQENFLMSTPCILKTSDKYRLHTKPLHKVGEGEITLNHSGFYYKGTKDGQPFQFFCEISAIPSAPFGPGVDFDIYYEDEYYCIEPNQNKIQVVKWMLACEELHNLIDEKWEKVSDDVYAYSAE